MAARTHTEPERLDSQEYDRARRPPRVLGPILLLIGIVVASAAGVGAAANLTDPVAPARVVHHEASPNERVPAAATQEPNANAREGRVAVTASALPNANTREGRVSTTPTGLTNADTRAVPASGNG
jgi:hypothetical protein